MRLSEWRPALVLLCAADVLVTLDGTVVTVALPAIERDLGTAQSALQWVVTAYTLTLGAFLLVGGRAGDLFGRRRVLVTGLIVFASASAVAGLAHTTELLLSARAVQGLGAALAVPGGNLTHLLPAFTVAGFSFAAAFVPLTSHGMSGVRDGEKGLASGLLQTSTHLGGAIVLSALATTATGAAVFTAGSATAFLIGATLLTLGAVTAARTLPRTNRP